MKLNLDFPAILNPFPVTGIFGNDRVVQLVVVLNQDRLPILSSHAQALSIDHFPIGLINF